LGKMATFAKLKSLESLKNSPGKKALRVSVVAS